VSTVPPTKSAMDCPYCNQKARLGYGDEIYPHRPDLSGLRFYICSPCQAWVGCHKGTTKPLGRLANAELRRAKTEAHNAFDPLWKFERFNTQKLKRSQAYQWLAAQLGIEFEACHIGMFDVETCQRVVELCKRQNLRIARKINI
jgi:zinc-finger-containing domain